MAPLETAVRKAMLDKGFVEVCRMSSKKMKILFKLCCCFYLKDLTPRWYTNSALIKLVLFGLRLRKRDIIAKTITYYFAPPTLQTA